MTRRDPSLWALLLVALALIVIGGGGLSIVAWWVWRVLEMTR
jgi:hypothetical protein